ncbi:hypothetical protein [Chromobacterium sp. Beijing]|uniref:hypothetical protein n=1 Tax=Chromobacterium sp. Beijing TaxID=2735795 RepID=UPI001F1D6D41|nr:hypothetical protein [Chromobacterium sp. Beijing]MCP1293395.1 hypothetical protein [Chromobacterium sp. S0633]
MMFGNRFLSVAGGGHCRRDFVVLVAIAPIDLPQHQVIEMAEGRQPLQGRCLRSLVEAAAQGLAV